MMYDDDALDRALAALPLEEPPAGLHARIMAATAYRPRSPFGTWEVWLVGTCVAFAVWLAWIVLSTPGITDGALAATARAIDLFGLSSLSTLVWLAVGLSAAFWVSQLTFPNRRIEAR